MKMYLISDNIDTLTGMRLAGVDGVMVHTREELRSAIEEAMHDKTVGIILLTEKFGRDFPEEKIKQIKEIVQKEDIMIFKIKQSEDKLFKALI